MCTRCFKCWLILLITLLVSNCGYRQTTPPAPEKASTLQRVAVPGGSLEYRVRGTGDPILMIHGSLVADVFDVFEPQPALANYRSIIYHRRGYSGSTRAPRPFTIEQQAADALAILDRLGIERAHVVGHSYGGTVALQMARQYPRRVASLVLLEPALPGMAPPDPEFVAAIGKAGQVYQQGDARGAVRAFMDGVAPGAWEQLTAAGLTAMQEQIVADAGTFFDVELPAIMQWQFGAPEAATLQVPALLVLGGNSTASARATHAALLRALPNAEEQLIAGAGHELQMQQPQPVADAIGAFLRKHPID